MNITAYDVRQALTELGKLRFGEMRVEDAMHEIVQATHAIFNVDGAGLMLADAEHHLRNVAVSDDRLRHLLAFQDCPAGRCKPGPLGQSEFRTSLRVGPYQASDSSRTWVSMRPSPVISMRTV